MFHQKLIIASTLIQYLLKPVLLSLLGGLLHTHKRFSLFTSMEITTLSDIGFALLMRSITVCYMRMHITKPFRYLVTSQLSTADDVHVSMHLTCGWRRFVAPDPIVHLGLICDCLHHVHPHVVIPSINGYHPALRW